jgi:hypothetical protein
MNKLVKNSCNYANMVIKKTEQVKKIYITFLVGKNVNPFYNSLTLYYTRADNSTTHNTCAYNSKAQLRKMDCKQEARKQEGCTHMMGMK